MLKPPFTSYSQYKKLICAHENWYDDMVLWFFLNGEGLMDMLIWFIYLPAIRWHCPVNRQKIKLKLHQTEKKEDELEMLKIQSKYCFGRK